MRCLSCNTILKDWEATNRSVVTNEELDLCERCLNEAGIVGTKLPPKKGHDKDEFSYPEIF